MENDPLPVPPDSDPLPVIAALVAAVTGLTKTIESLKLNEVRHRRNMRILVVTVAFDIMLSVTIGLIGASALHASQRARQAVREAAVSAKLADNQALTLYNNCLSRNESRAQLVAVFDHLLGTRTQSGTSVAISSLEAYVAKSFPQIDCGPKPVPTTISTPTS
jgi:cell division protein FtsB